MKQQVFFANQENFDYSRLAFLLPVIKMKNGRLSMRGHFVMDDFGNAVSINNSQMMRFAESNHH